MTYIMWLNFYVFILNWFHRILIIFQAEDYIDELLNGESYADSLKYDSNAMSEIRIKEEPQVFSEAEAKDRQKKDNHNMSKKQN